MRHVPPPCNHDVLLQILCFGAHGPGVKTNSAVVPALLHMTDVYRSLRSLVLTFYIFCTRLDYRGSAAGREAQGFSMAHSEAVKAAFSGP